MDVPRETILYRPIYTSITEISLGETPLILEACETVAGFIEDNFSNASYDRDFSFE